MQKLFDCHIHIEQGFENYTIESEKVNVIFNSLANYYKYEKQVPVGSVISIILDLDNLDTVRKICDADNRVKCLKIHARIQKLRKQDYERIDQILNSFDSRLAIIYDAFYYGPDLEYQPNLEELILLIRNHSKRKFIIAHCGGHKALEYLFHLRPFNNVYYDLSFSLAYLQGTSAELDLVHLIKVTPKDRILFGTDFPHVDAEKQLEISLAIFAKLNFTVEEIEKCVYNNAVSVYHGEI